MPVTMILPFSSTNQSRCSAGRSEAWVEQTSKSLAIGLVNNMPDGALESTEQQFVSLLNDSSGEVSVNLSFYFLPEIPRSARVQDHIDQHYRSVESLCDAELDGLIVTGKEPIAPNLPEEPFWNSFVYLLEWAREKTYSTIWSCLAAHAAVLQMDGIQRTRSSQKHSGIIESTRIADHPITANLPARFRLPHSRWNGLSESDLIRAGYQVMIRAGGAGVDCFIKREQSLFIFIQSHPEYRLDTLLMEYRRDVARFLRGESDRYPNVPQGYFDDCALCEFAEVQREATTRPHGETFARLGILFSTVGEEDGWHTTATTLYRNWLQYISSEKRACMQKQQRVEFAMLLDDVTEGLSDPAVLISR